MGLLGKWRKADSGAIAVAESPVSSFIGADEALMEEIHSSQAANRRHPSLQTERRLVGLRHLAGIRVLERPPAQPQHPTPRKPPLRDGLPVIEAAEVTPELIRGGILGHGCLVVRGLLPRAESAAFAEGIERAFAERVRSESGQPFDARYYTEFDPLQGHGEPLGRGWIKQGGGVLAIDSPRLSFELHELFDTAGVLSLVRGYLGEAPLVTAQKTTLRKAEPQVAGGWHQDGKFMGEVSALNLWVALSRCGDESPGLDIVPRRFEQHVTAFTDEAPLDYVVSQRVAEEVAGDAGILRPVFDPGDAVFFDELLLHKTGSDPSMPKPRFAIENWFFGGSSFPPEYAPLIP